MRYNGNEGRLMQLIIPKKRNTRYSELDYIRFDPLTHQLEVGLHDQKLTFMGVPDSMYARLITSESPDLFFKSDIYNKYPVVVTPAPMSPQMRRRLTRK